MPIRFRCEHCQQLMSIATRKAGSDVDCARCGQSIRVPEPEADLSALRAPASEASPAADRIKTASTVPAPRAGILEAAPTTSATHADADPDTQTDEDPPIRFRRKSPPTEEMDLTPMVDMTFLLLIFFMITASFSQQKTLQVPPPDSEKKGAMQSIEEIQDLLDSSLQIEVDARNVIRVDEDVQSDMSQLGAVLREKMRVELKTEALVKIDPRALHETVVRVVDACNEAGIQKIRLASQSVPD